METIFSTSNGRNAARRSMYQATPFGTPPLGRQADPLRGSYVSSSQHSSSCSGSSSWVLWRDEPGSLYQDPRARRGRLCSALLAVAVFLVVLTVLSIAGLAVYMGALRIDTNKPELVFDGSLRVISGDNFVPSFGNNSSTAFKEMALKYQNMVDRVYQRSQLRPAYKKCVIQKFENGSLIVFFRLYLDRRKIPRNFQNVEETARDILVNELIVPQTTAFKNIQIDATSIFIKRSLDDTVMSPVEGTARKKPSGNRTLQMHNGVLRKAVTEGTSVLNNTYESPTVLKQENSEKKENHTKEITSKTQKMEGEAIPIIEGTVVITKIKETAMEKPSDDPQTLKDGNNATSSKAESTVIGNTRGNYAVSKAPGNSVPENIGTDADGNNEGSSKHVLNSTAWAASISEIDFPGTKTHMKSETSAKLTTDSAEDTKYSFENNDRDPLRPKTHSPHIGNKKQSIENDENLHFGVETITKFSAMDVIRKDAPGIKQDYQEQNFETPSGNVTDLHGNISHNADVTLMKKTGENDVLLMGSRKDFTENPLTFKTNTYNDHYHTQATPGLNSNFWSTGSINTPVPTSLNVPGAKSNYSDTELTSQHFQESFLHSVTPPRIQTDEPWRPVLPYYTKSSPKPDDADIGTGVAEVVVVPPSAVENEKANYDQYTGNRYSSRLGQPAPSHNLPDSLSGGYGSFSLHPNLQEPRPNDTISRVSLHVISSGGVNGENLETNILPTTSGGGIIVRRQHQPLLSATFPPPHTIPLTYTTSKPPTTHRAIANPFTVPELPILHQFHDVDAILKAVPHAKNTASNITLHRHQSESFQGDFTINRKWMDNSSNGGNTDPRNPNLGTGSVPSDKQQWIELPTDATNVKLQHTSYTEAFPTRYHQQPVWGDMGNKGRTGNSQMPLKGTDIPSVVTSVESYLSRIHVNKSTRVQLAALNPLGDAVANTPFSIVTLIPVRSNSGVGKPLRPRPKLPSHVVVQIKNDTEPMDVVLLSEYALKNKAEDHGLSSLLPKPMESDVVNGVEEANISLKRKGNLAGFNKKSEGSMINFNQSSTEEPQHNAGSIAIDHEPQSSDKYSTELPTHPGIISSLSQQTSALSPLSLKLSSKIPPTVDTIVTSLNITQTQSPTKTVPLSSATRPMTTSSIQQSTSEILTQSVQQLTSEKLTSNVQLTSEKPTTLPPKQGTFLAASSTISPVTTSSSTQNLTSKKFTTLPTKKGTFLAASSTVSPVTTSSNIQHLTSKKVTTLPSKQGTFLAASSTVSPVTMSSSTQHLTSKKFTTLPPKQGTFLAAPSTVSPETTSSSTQHLTSKKSTTLPPKQGTFLAASSTVSPITTSSNIQHLTSKKFTTLPPKQGTFLAAPSTVSPETMSSSTQHLTPKKSTTLPPKQGTFLAASSTLSPITTSSNIQHLTSKKFTTLPPKQGIFLAASSTVSPVTISSSIQLTSKKLIILPSKKGSSSAISSTVSPISTSLFIQLTSQKWTTLPPKEGTSSATASTSSPMITTNLPLRKITQPSTVPATKVIKTPIQSSSLSSSRIKSTQTTTRTTLPPSILLSKTAVNANDSTSYTNHESQNNETATDEVKNTTHTVESTTVLSISTLQQGPFTEVQKNITAHSSNSSNTNIKEINRRYTSQVTSPNQQKHTTRSPSHSTQTTTVPVSKNPHSTTHLPPQSTIIHTLLTHFIPVVVTQDSADEIWHRNNSHKKIAKVDSTVPTLETSSNASDVDDGIGGQRKDITHNSTSTIKNAPKTKNNTALRTPQLRDKNATENGQHQNASVTIPELPGGNNSTAVEAESAAENIRNIISPPNLVTPHLIVLNTDTVTTTSIEISFGENEEKVVMNPLKSSQASHNITQKQVHSDQSSDVYLPITVPSAVMEITSTHNVKETRRQPKMKLTNTYSLSSHKLRLEQHMMDSNGNLKTEERADTDLLMPKVEALTNTTTTVNIVSDEDNERKNITLMSAEYEPGNHNYSTTLNIPRTISIKLNSTAESPVPENSTPEQVLSAEEETILANVNVPPNVRTHLTKDGSSQNEEFPVNFSFTVAEDPLLQRTNEKIIPTTEEVSSTLYDIPMPNKEIFSTEDEVANTGNDTLEIFTNFTVTKVTASSNMQGKPPPQSFDMSDDDIVRLLNVTRNHSIMSQEIVNTLSKYANIHTAISSHNITQDTKVNVYNDEDRISHETTENYVGEKITNIMPTEEAKLSTKAILPHGSNSHAGIPILTKIYNKVPQPFGEKVSSTEASNLANSTACPSNQSLRCGDGECISSLSRCNQLVDCSDGMDEQGCSCADYLKAQFLTRKLCDGVVDCWDFSDENNCEWCTPGQFVCPNSQVCVDQHQLCDGARDCPYGDDEKQCVTIAQNEETAGDFPYNSEGYLMVRKQGRWGKLCLQNFDKVAARSQAEWEVADLGRAVCKAMTYSDFERVNRTTDTVSSSRADSSHYFQLAYSSDVNSNTSQPRSSLSFQETNCNQKEVVHISCRDLQCGIRPQAINQWARIVGGGNAAPGSWPWQAALYKEGEFQCGATLIADRWLVSAGHCFYHALDDYWVARLGALRRGSSFPSPYEQLRPVSHIILHPGYVDAGFLNDISLLRLRDPVQFSDFVRPVCLPPAPIRDGRLCTVVGWGQLFEVGRIFPDTLQEVQLPVISTAECRKRTLFLPLYRVTDNMFCAGFDRGGRDACLGDSGGPLMCQEKDGHWSLYGVTSNGYGCARANRPGVYTKVANYIPWLQAAMAQQVSSLRDSKTQCKGHRCPLGECLPPTRVCNGFMECSDGSDEKGCW